MLKYRDIREDGLIFWGYRILRGKPTESWYSPEAFARVLAGKARRKRERKKTQQDLARQASYQKAYKKRNPHKVYKDYALRQERVKLTGNASIVAMFYEIRERVSKCTGIMWHVDHIKPLAKGGQHHENNLQVITAKANMRKSIS